MLNRSILLSAALLSALGATAQTPLLETARNAPQMGPDYAYQLSYTDNDMTAKALIDPHKREGNRVLVLSPEQSRWSDDFDETLKQLNKAPMAEFWCSDFLKFVGRDARLEVETQDSATYTFQPKPSPDDDKDDRKFLAEMQAHVTLDKKTGAVQLFSMTNREPFKPIFIAKIKSFKLSARCEASPDGRYFIAQMETRITGSIALKKFEEFEVRIVSNLQALDQS